MLTQSLILLVTLSLSGLLAWGGVRRLRHARVVAAGWRLASAGTVAVAGIGLFGITSNLYTYERLTSEQPVARLHFSKVSAQVFTVRFQPRNGEPRQFELHGDEWMLDARVLKWKGYASLLGFDPVFRLDRLSGRFSDLKQARTQPLSAYQLGEETGSESWVNLWQLARTYESGLVDAVYGNSVFLPMDNEVSYQVTMTRSGLIARPL